MSSQAETLNKLKREDLLGGRSHKRQELPGGRTQMLSAVSNEVSHKRGFNNRTFFFTPKMYRVSVPSFRKLWKC